LLSPDIHGLLLALSRPNILHASELRNILMDEYSKIGSVESMLSQSPEKIISGTNIELTLSFHNPDIDQHNHPDHKKNHVQVTF
jgi:hypothetical protein